MSSSSSSSYEAELSFIEAGMDVNPDTRLSIDQLATHPFFEEVNIHELHTQPPPPDLQLGLLADSEEDDGRWTKRQFSSIWMPLPRAITTQWKEGGGVGVGMGTLPLPVETELEKGASFLTT